MASVPLVSMTYLLIFLFFLVGTLDTIKSVDLFASVCFLPRLFHFLIQFDIYVADLIEVSFIMWMPLPIALVMDLCFGSSDLSHL